MKHRQKTQKLMHHSTVCSTVILHIIEFEIISIATIFCVYFLSDSSLGIRDDSLERMLPQADENDAA